jgi:hypothetical protein
MSGCAATAGLELAAADSMDLIRQTLAQSVTEYNNDLARLDAERRVAAIHAFIARIRTDAADEQKAQTHAEAFLAALELLERDRQVAWQRYTATIDNLAVLGETAADLRRLAVQSLSLEDETKRYFSELLEAQKRKNTETKEKEGTATP